MSTFIEICGCVVAFIGAEEFLDLWTTQSILLIFNSSLIVFSLLNTFWKIKDELRKKIMKDCVECDFVTKDNKVNKAENDYTNVEGQ